jgi:DNA-binding response OmpR family regulator
LARKRILAVDDDATALGALRQILTQRGYDVATAADGEDALKQLAAETFDLVLLDVILPGMSGYDVCRRLRAEPRTRELPVVFLTARGDMADMREGQAAGSDLYLVKPVSATRLANMVAMFLSPDAPLARRPRPNPNA